MMLPWPKAQRLLEQISKERTTELIELATAARAAQTDEKGWRQWLKLAD